MSQFENLPRSSAQFETHARAAPISYRGYVYAAAVVALGKAAPAEWRENAKRMLFPVERPYF